MFLVKSDANLTRNDGQVIEEKVEECPQRSLQMLKIFGEGGIVLHIGCRVVKLATNCRSR